MCLAISSPDGPGDVPVEDGDVVGVDAQQLQRGVAVAGDVGGDRLQAQAIADGLGHVGLVLDDQARACSDATSRRISPAYRKPHTGRQRRAPLTARRAPAACQLLWHRSSSRVLAATPRPSAPRRPRRRRRGSPTARVHEASGARPARSRAPRRPAPGGPRRRAATASSSSSTAAGARRRIRRGCSARRSRSTARRRRPARWVATPGTSAHVSGDAVDIGRSGAARGWPSTAPRTGCAGSTPTSPGTSSCARRPSATAARPCTPTRPTIRGCSSDDQATTAGRARHGRPRSARAAARTPPPRPAPPPARRTPPRPRPPPRQDKAVKFAECIRAHGVPHFPDPDAKGEFVFGIDVSPAVWQQAVDACKDLEPPGALSGKRSPKQQSASPQVRPVHARERREGLPGPRQRRARSSTRRRSRPPTGPAA